MLAQAARQPVEPDVGGGLDVLVGAAGVDDLADDADLTVGAGEHLDDALLVAVVLAGAEGVEGLHCGGEAAFGDGVDEVEDGGRALVWDELFDGRFVDVRVAGEEGELVDGLGEGAAVAVGAVDEAAGGVAGEMETALLDLAAQPVEGFVGFEALELADGCLGLDLLEDRVGAAQVFLDEDEQRRRGCLGEQLAESVPIAEGGAAAARGVESGAKSVDADPAEAAEEGCGGDGCAQLAEGEACAVELDGVVGERAVGVVFASEGGDGFESGEAIFAVEEVVWHAASVAVGRVRRWRLGRGGLGMLCWRGLGCCWLWVVLVGRDSRQAGMTEGAGVTNVGRMV